MSFAFWFVYILAVVFSYWSGGYYRPGMWRPFGPYLAIFVLVGLLGWRVFGFIIQ